MTSDGPPITVKALYVFKGMNNDELNFQKNDIITITQMPDGGWWEGTLKGVTGWFPSNYVKEYKQDLVADRKSPQGTKSNDAQNVRQETITMYRNVVLKDILDSEVVYVKELNFLMSTFLQPLQMSDILTPEKYNILIGNISEVIDSHSLLLKSLEECNDVSPSQQRIGGAFMQLAPLLKSVHLIYYANHPKAVTVLEKYRDQLNDFMESYGAPVPGFRALTAGLSKPFRRLEKYRGLLLELEHHIEENHVDRGDTQRAAHVYKDIAEACTSMRRNKEMELEVLQGNIRGWEGEDVQNLGDILLMSQVAMIKESQEQHERYLVLFSNTLVILSVSPRMSTFVYEGKLPLGGISVSRMEDADSRSSFEITGNMIDKIVVHCNCVDDCNKWVAMIKQQILLSCSSLTGSSKVPTLATNHASPSPLVTLLENRSRMSTTVKSPYIPPSQVWTNSCLRPAPPLRPCLALGSKDEANARRSRLQKIKAEHYFEDDARLLKVIEAYCTSAKTRQTVNSTFIDSPQVILPEEEKIINEVFKGNQTVIEEKSLVDTVYAMKDQMKAFQEETRALAKALDDEQKCRKRLEEIIKKYLLCGRDDIKWDDVAS